MLTFSEAILPAGWGLDLTSAMEVQYSVRWAPGLFLLTTKNPIKQ